MHNGPKSIAGKDQGEYASTTEKLQGSCLFGQEIINQEHVDHVALEVSINSESSPCGIYLTNFDPEHNVHRENISLGHLKILNDSPFHNTLHGFTIRKGKIRYVGNSSVWRGRNYLCLNAGLKDTSYKVPRKFSKLDYPTYCEAYIDFVIDEKGVWTAVKHNMDHNHAMIPV
uniref:FAR1 domain-containing protein n=1 Tax=Chenopodium quinoa TaxID=63459 RepID=A0A803N9J8_CHEQI